MRSIVLIPEALVAVATGACVLAVRWRRRPRPLGAAVVVLLLVALGSELWLGAAVGTLFAGGFTQDRFALFTKAAFLVATVVLVALSDAREEVDEGPLGRAPALLVCFAGMVVASSTQLLGLWVGLALAVVAGTALVGLPGPDRSEAARTMVGRVVVVGTLLGLIGVGFAFLYGLGGASQLSQMQIAFGKVQINRALVVSVGLVVLGLVGLMAVAVAGAGYGDRRLPISGLSLGAAGLSAGVVAVVLFKVLATASPVVPGWAPLVAVLATGGIVGAGLGAIGAQTPRLQVGYLVAGQLAWVVLAVVADYRLGLGAALFLFGTWLLAATALPSLLRAAFTGSWRDLPGIGSGSGLARIRAAGLVVGILSVAGVPPLGGWLGQFGVLIELGRAGWWWVVALAFLGWVLAVVGCLRLVRSMLLESEEVAERGRGSRRTAAEGARVLRGTPLAWGGAIGLVAVLAVYPIFAYPIHSLALQGAQALGLH